MIEDLTTLMSDNPDLIEAYRKTYALTLAEPGHKLTVCSECGGTITISGAIQYQDHAVRFCARCGDPAVMPQAVVNTFYSRYGDKYYRPTCEDYKARRNNGGG